MLSPSLSLELSEVMIMRCFSFVSSLSVTPLYPYSLVLKEREWGLGGFKEGVPRAKLSLVFSLVLQLWQPWTTNEMLSTTPQDLSWGPLVPAKRRLPYLFHRNFNSVKNSFVIWSFIRNGNVLRIFYSSACYKNSSLLSDTHSGFWPLWWSRLLVCWIVIPCSSSEVILNLTSSWCMFSISSILFYFFSKEFVKRKGILLNDEVSLLY